MLYVNYVININYLLIEIKLFFNHLYLWNLYETFIFYAIKVAHVLFEMKDKNDLELQIKNTQNDKV